MKQIIILLAICCMGSQAGFAQSKDSARPKQPVARPYFIITAGERISAYFNDKPLAAETVAEFTEYIQANARLLKDANVVVTGKPKTGTFDDVIKILSRYHIKNVTKNISKD